MQLKQPTSPRWGLEEPSLASFLNNTAKSHQVSLELPFILELINIIGRSSQNASRLTKATQKPSLLKQSELGRPAREFHSAADGEIWPLWNPR